MIIGLGCGRCGTTSLAEILRLPHEGTLLPWDFQERRYRVALNRALQAGGDVGYSWLNYVERTLEWHPDTRFLCLRRDREATLRSWQNHMKGREFFGWTGFDPDAAESKTYETMPTFGGVSVEEGAPLYYDLYYQRSQELQKQYPKRFRIFDAHTVLNTRKGQREMLRFSKRSQPLRLKVRKNPVLQEDGAEMKNLMIDMARRVVEVGGGKLSPEDSDRMRRLARSKYGDHENYDLNVTVHAR